MGQVIRVQVVGPAIVRLTAEAFLVATPGLDPVERDGHVVWAFGVPGTLEAGDANGPPSSNRQHWLVVITERAAELTAVRAAGVRVIVGDNEPGSVLRQAIEAAASGCAFTSPNLAALEEANGQSALRRRTPADASQLSRREREVALLRAQGRDRAEIAAELMVSENTVKTHLLHIHRKLGVQGQEDLALKLRTDS